MSIYNEFMMDLKANKLPSLKTREQEKYNKKQKKKYFRETKVYQNEYIEELHEKGAIKHFQADREEYDPKHCIVYLFFSEKREYFLLLGRGESKDFIHEDADDSSCSEHRNHEQDGRML